jgi:hypothetical protein
MNRPRSAIADRAGNIYIANTRADEVLELPVGGGGPITLGSGWNSPQQLALDGAGNLYVADANNGRVVELPAGGAAPVVLVSGLTYPDGVAVYVPPLVLPARAPSTSLPRGTAYHYSFAATGATGYALLSGTLPPGLHLDLTSGRLSGTPTTSGTYRFVVQAQNAVASADTNSVTITVAAPLSTQPTTRAALPTAVDAGGPSAGGRRAANASGPAPELLGSVLLVVAGIGFAVRRRPARHR